MQPGGGRGQPFAAPGIVSKKLAQRYVLYFLKVLRQCLPGGTPGKPVVGGLNHRELLARKYG